MAGLYIHIPFCKSRCIYCDFFSTTNKEKCDAYIEALCAEAQHRCRHEDNESTFDTIYIGGGTPSWIGINRLIHIFEHLTYRSTGEITIECNPDDVTDEFIEGLHQLPVNRISFGVQSLTDERLQLIGRRHTAQQAIDAIESLQHSGYNNISIDLMYGLPGQTMQEWQRDLSNALSLGTPHLSAYSLTYEYGTRLWRLREEHRMEEAPEELSADMYEHLIDTCVSAGLMQYELSNFAMPSYHSRHNSAYWQGKPYIGIGAAAHSFDGHDTRTFNKPDLDTYIAYWTNPTHVPPPIIIEHLTHDEQFNERIFTSLRTRHGLDWTQITHDYPTQSETIKKALDRHVALGNLTWEDKQLRLTRKALFISDDVMSDLMVV